MAKVVKSVWINISDRLELLEWIMKNNKYFISPVDNTDKLKPEKP